VCQWCVCLSVRSCISVMVSLELPGESVDVLQTLAFDLRWSSLTTLLKQAVQGRLSVADWTDWRHGGLILAWVILLNVEYIVILSCISAGNCLSMSAGDHLTVIMALLFSEYIMDTGVFLCTELVVTFCVLKPVVISAVHSLTILRSALKCGHMFTHRQKVKVTCYKCQSVSHHVTMDSAIHHNWMRYTAFKADSLTIRRHWDWSCTE